MEQMAMRYVAQIIITDEIEVDDRTLPLDQAQINVKEELSKHLEELVKDFLGGQKSLNVTVEQTYADVWMKDTDSNG